MPEFFKALNFRKFSGYSFPRKMYFGKSILLCNSVCVDNTQKQP